MAIFDMVCGVESRAAVIAFEVTDKMGTPIRKKHHFTNPCGMLLANDG